MATTNLFESEWSGPAISNSSPNTAQFGALLTAPSGSDRTYYNTFGNSTNPGLLDEDWFIYFLPSGGTLDLSRVASQATKPRIEVFNAWQNNANTAGGTPYAVLAENADGPVTVGNINGNLPIVYVKVFAYGGYGFSISKGSSSATTPANATIRDFESYGGYFAGSSNKLFGYASMPSNDTAANAQSLAVVNNDNWSGNPLTIDGISSYANEDYFKVRLDSAGDYEFIRNTGTNDTVAIEVISPSGSSQWINGSGNFSPITVTSTGQGFNVMIRATGSTTTNTDRPYGFIIRKKATGTPPPPPVPTVDYASSMRSGINISRTFWIPEMQQGDVGQGTNRATYYTGNDWTYNPFGHVSETMISKLAGTNGSNGVKHVRIKIGPEFLLQEVPKPSLQNINDRDNLIRVVNKVQGKYGTTPIDVRVETGRTSSDDPILSYDSNPSDQYFEKWFSWNVDEQKFNKILLFMNQLKSAGIASVVTPYNFNYLVEYGTYGQAWKFEYVRELNHPFNVPALVATQSGNVNQVGWVKGKMFDISPSRRAQRVEWFGNLLSDIASRLRTHPSFNGNNTRFAAVSIMNEPGWMRSSDGQVLDKPDRVVIRKEGLVNGEPNRADYDAVHRENGKVVMKTFHERRFESSVPSPFSSAGQWNLSLPNDQATQVASIQRSRTEYYAAEASWINKIRDGDTPSGGYYQGRPIVSAPNSINNLGGIEALLGIKRKGTSVTSGVPDTDQKDDDMKSAEDSSRTSSVAADTNLMYDVHTYDPYQYAYHGDWTRGNRDAAYWMREMPYVSDRENDWDNAIQNAANRYKQPSGDLYLKRVNPGDPFLSGIQDMAQYVETYLKAGKFGTKNYLRYGSQNPSDNEGAGGIQGLIEWASRPENSNAGTSVYVGEFGFLADYTINGDRKDLFKDSVELMNLGNSSNRLIGWSVWALDDSKVLGFVQSRDTTMKKQWNDRFVLQPLRAQTNPGNYNGDFQLDTSVAAAIGLTLAN
jgi:hypothetical protein